MIHRLLEPSKRSSFFLFGPRGTGKSTLLGELFRPEECLSIDLLDPEQEDRYARQPAELERELERLRTDPRKRWVIVDEVQKAPRLLDSVHRWIEKSRFRFALTGSSARKLKRGVSNLLAGRALVHHLHPLTATELGSRFDLNHVLRWGSLPGTLRFSSDVDRADFLRAYALTYLKEEVIAEQLVRRLNPFRNFLEIAAQCNGQILNFSKIADDLGVDTKTVQAYFSILEETLVGFLLPAYHTSLRKRQRANPKFYCFDTGVKRALDRTLNLELSERTYGYGNAFEHFLILEAIRLNDYGRKDWRMSYLRTKDDAEIDLIIERPGLPLALVEIKSGSSVGDADVRNLERFARDIGSAEAFCLSRDKVEKRIGRVNCLPWRRGLGELGLEAA